MTSRRQLLIAMAGLTAGAMLRTAAKGCDMPELTPDDPRHHPFRYFVQTADQCFYSPSRLVGVNGRMYELPEDAVMASWHDGRNDQARVHICDNRAFVAASIGGMTCRAHGAIGVGGYVLIAKRKVA